MRRLLAFTLASISLIPCVACSSNEKQLTTERLTTELREQGGQAVRVNYFPCEAYEGTGYEQVAGGSSAWVQLAAQLLDHSDACYTIGLQDALGSAMQAAPENVLPYVGRNSLLAPERICLPFISAEIPAEDQLKQLDRSRLGIEKIRDTQLNTQRKACLDEIERVGQMIKSKPAPR